MANGFCHEECISPRCDDSSVSEKTLQQLIDYGLSRIDYMGHQHCHFAMIYTTKGKTPNVLSYGFNHIRNKKSIHAEVDAINNLPPITRRRKKLTKVNILVIKFSKSGHKIGNSKCCMKCCETIFKIPPLRGYTIDSVSYSNKEGNIEDYHPIDLLIEEDYHTSFYYRRKGYTPKFRDRIIKHPDRLTKMFLEKSKEEED